MENILTFSDRKAFREWLDKYGAESGGIWLLFRKKGEPATISANEALEEALCYGWIDGQMQSLENNTYKKYFARRRAASNWSEKNKELALKLIERGLMTRWGVEAVERAQKNGLWEKSKRIHIDEEQIQMFKQVIQPYEPAYTNLSAMAHSVQRTYTGFYLDAKSDKTRQARLEKIIERLNKNLKPM